MKKQEKRLYGLEHFDGAKRISIMTAKNVVDEIKKPMKNDLHLKDNGKKTPKDKQPYHSYVITVATNAYSIL